MDAFNHEFGIFLHITIFVMSDVRVLTQLLYANSNWNLFESVVEAIVVVTYVTLEKKGSQTSKLNDFVILAIDPGSIHV